MSHDSLPLVTRSRPNSRQKRYARREADAKWFRDKCIDAAWRGRAVSFYSCSPDFGGDVVRDDGSVNWAAAFAMDDWTPGMKP
jgi:hypothetical protein